MWHENLFGVSYSMDWISIESVKSGHNFEQNPSSIDHFTNKFLFFNGIVGFSLNIQI